MSVGKRRLWKPSDLSVRNWCAILKVGLLNLFSVNNFVLLRNLQSSKILDSHSSEILDPVLKCMDRQMSGKRIRLIAAHALLSSLEFAHSHFEREVLNITEKYQAKEVESIFLLGRSKSNYASSV